MRVLNKLICLLPIFLFFFTLVGCDVTIGTGGNGKEFEVKFLVDGEVISSEKVKYEENATEVAVPSKEGYNFVGWDKEFTNVKSDLEINAIYEVRTFEVKFLIDGELYETIKVEYGKSVELDAPLKIGYQFVGWDKDLSEVKSNLRVKAIYEEKILEIKFFVDGTLYETKQIGYGESVEISNPEKDGCKFIGWDKELDNLVENLEVNAIFEEMPEEKEKLEVVYKTLEEYFDGLTYPLENCYLDLFEEKEGIKISWTSSNEKIIMLNGRVIQPYTANKEEEVILKAHFELNGCVMNASFNVKVKRGYKDLSKGINAIYNYNSSYLSEAALSTYDIVYYAFLGLKQDASGDLGATITVKSNIKGYKDKLHAQGGRVMVSVVANLGDQMNNIRKIADNDKALTNMVNNLLNLCIENDYDGIDIDWETPGNDGGEAYTKLMKKLYETFKAYDENLLITSAIGAGPWQPPKYNLQDSAKYHDYINMMAYDMQGGGVASFQNALYYKYKATVSGCSIDETIDLYNSYGIKNSQIIIGVPFYGRVLKGATTLWGSGTWSDSINQTTINSYIKNGAYKVVYDEDCQVPYLYSESKNEFITYENSRSIDAKWKYIALNGLAGMMAWQLTNDNNDTLTLAMRSGKNRYM